MINYLQTIALALRAKSARAASVLTSAALFMAAFTTPAQATLLDAFITGFVNIFSGVFVGGIGFLAICVVAIFFAIGRLEFTRFVVIALGIAMLLGAANVVNYIQTQAAI